MKSCKDNCETCSNEFMGVETILQCIDGECTNTYCKNASDCQKLHGDPVTGQWLAVNGLCSVMGCKEDIDCTNSFGVCTRCSEGVCINKSCTDNKECPDGYSCINGVCGSIDPPSTYSSVLVIIIMLVIVVVLAVVIYILYTKLK
jgi:hypothetical protein